MNVLALVALGVGCGDEKRVGGSITIAQSAQPDFLDPALSNTLNGWEPMWLVYTPLLTYRRAEGRAGSELIPALAEELPRISRDGKTYTLKLRAGLRYSNERSVRASDFERAVQRVLNLESAGTQFFRGIVGADRYIRGGRSDADIAGIVADDRTRDIRITLVAPDGTFSNALATNYSGLVPGNTPFRNLTKSPPPGVGPYRITRSVPNREFVMERVKGFDLPGIPAGKLDRIRTEIVTNVARQTQDVIRGRLDYMQDPPPPDLLPEVRSKYSDRFREFVTPSTSYFFLNTRVAPFDKEDVRKAVNFALDESALARLSGGLLEPSCNFLPPTVPGYRRLDPCPYGALGASPDVKRARQLVRRAGAAGAEVSVWSFQQPPGPQIASYYADVLRDIGLHAKEKLLDFAVYQQTLGSQRTHAQTGFESWAGDFPHPYSFLRQFSGAAISETANINLGNVRDRELDQGIARLSRNPDVGRVEEGWAALDRRLVERAYVAVYGHPKGTTFLSERMDFRHCSRVHPLYRNDYSSFCLKD